MEPDQWADTARWYAFGMIVLAAVVFLTGTKWWRTLTLVMTALLFLSLVIVLVHGLVAAAGLYPPEWRPWIVVGQWAFIGTVFLLWAIAFVREQFRCAPRTGGTSTKRVNLDGK